VHSEISTFVFEDADSILKLEYSNLQSFYEFQERELLRWMMDEEDANRDWDGDE
jgi:hypothetical protein